jgi:hypothetical protein
MKSSGDEIRLAVHYDIIDRSAFFLQSKNVALELNICSLSKVLCFLQGT